MKRLDVLRFSMGFLWLWSGIQPALTAADMSLDLLGRAGIAAEWQMAAFYASSALDVFFGVLCFIGFRRILWGFMFHQIQKLPFCMAITICRSTGLQRDCGVQAT